MMLLEIIIIICSLRITPTVSEELKWPIAKHGCQDHCGNVSIPFPFGIGSHCSVDKWFQIECDDSGISPKLYLKHSNNFEILNITYSYYGRWSKPLLQVKNPISFYNCQSKEDLQPLDLTGKPFKLRQNTFVAVSCGIIAKLNSNSTRSYNSASGGYTYALSESETGCTSTCSTENINNSLCNGTNCCEIPNVSAGDNFEISFDNKSKNEGNHDNGECKFAFLVDYVYWYYYKNRSTDFAEIRDQGFVPTTLSWQLNYTDWDIFKKHMPYIGPETTHYCETYTDEPFLYCECGEGLQGNPYLIDGCQGNPNPIYHAH